MAPVVLAVMSPDLRSMGVVPHPGKADVANRRDHRMQIEREPYQFADSAQIGNAELGCEGSVAARRILGRVERIALQREAIGLSRVVLDPAFVIEDHGGPMVGL